MIEKQIRGTSPEQRRAVRQQRAKPLVAELEAFIRAQRERLSSKSNMGQALAYLANHWQGLCLYLDDGRVEMDSNPVENLIMLSALNCKNSLFAGHHEGAQNWARLASLIATGKLNGIEPFAYMKATIEALVAGHRNAEIDQLLPRNLQGAARCGCGVTSLYRRTPAKLPHSFATNIAVFVAKDVAARAAKTAGVNRKVPCHPDAAYGTPDLPVANYRVPLWNAGHRCGSQNSVAGTAFNRRAMTGAFVIHLDPWPSFRRPRTSNEAVFLCRATASSPVDHCGPQVVVAVVLQAGPFANRRR